MAKYTYISAMKLEFTKMEGLGNDYIYVDASRYHIQDPAALSVRLSDRHFGVGADGLVLIGRSESADFSMQMFNADGSEGAMCGNAARCIGKYVWDKGLTSKRSLTLSTRSGIKHLSLHIGEVGLVDSVTVGMGSYRIVELQRELQAGGKPFRGTVVDVGNPHFVVFCGDAAAVDPSEHGPAIERCFPGGINVEFASVEEPERIRMRVWERGSGVTLACGTGACATAAAAVSHGLCSGPISIVMDGGTLSVTCNNGSILMNGPARTVFEGVVEI